MSGTTISVVSNSEFVFSSASQNPLLITGGGGIDVVLEGIDSAAFYAPAIYGAIPASIVNFGSVQSDVVTNFRGQNDFAAIGVGIRLEAGGTITNGSQANTTALIAGNQDGISIGGLAQARIVNYGTITTSGFADSQTLATGAGVVWISEGILVNGSDTDTKALISGGGDGGINSFGDIDIENFGTISATGFGGVILEGGASSIANGSSIDKSAFISGGPNGDGVALYQGTLLNFGTVTGGSNSSGTDHYGVDIQTDGYAVNQGTIIGFAGVEMNGRGQQTLVNDGVIEGTGGIAVNVKYAGSLLIVDPGAVFEGNVDGNASVLELGSGTGAGILLGVGTSFVNFAQISIAAQASWTIEGDVAGLAGQPAIAGFGRSDKIVVDGFDAVSETYVSGTGLELSDAADTVMTLDITGSFSTGNFIVAGKPAETVISLAANAPCFAAGTWILTPRGQVRVEALEVGDHVISRAGEDCPICWIGRRQIDLSRHPCPAQAQPICIAADALGDGVPLRDLWVSPDHALFFDGYLIPAKALVNDVSIYQLHRASVDYYHIELAEHGIIFAENAAVESYLETGNRGAFENGGGVRILHPDFAQRIRVAQSCATFTDAGPAFQAVRLRLFERGAARAVSAEGSQYRSGMGGRPRRWVSAVAARGGGVRDVDPG